MRRRVHHYDLPHTAFDYQKQMCGRLALVFLSSIAVACLVGVVVMLVKLLATALVIVQ